MYWGSLRIGKIINSRIFVLTLIPKKLRLAHYLHCASIGGEIAIMQLLIKKGVDIDARDKEGETAIYHPCLRAMNKVVQFLIAEGAQCDIQNRKGVTLLYNIHAVMLKVLILPVGFWNKV